jgi:hypothetical protein
MGEGEPRKLAKCFRVALTGSGAEKMVLVLVE